MLNPLEMAIAHVYAQRELERRQGNRPKHTKTKWALLFWFIGFGFLI